MTIRAEGIVKRFPAMSALAGVDLAVRTGELVALLGPSGSGKTTLLRVIAGLERPDAGRVYFGEEDATELPVQRRGVGFVFQHYALFRHMNVADNVAYGLRVRPRATRPSEAEIRRRVSTLLELVQLSGTERRFPAELSGGQRQRVALARALAVDPKVLLLDEPFGALDAKVRRELRRWLREIHGRLGHTTLFVTHDQDEALELADRVAVLNQGRIEQIGTPDEIYDRPATGFVAGFIGESVRLRVNLDKGAVVIGPHRIDAPQAPSPSGEAELFLRPCDLTLADGAPDAVAARVTGVRRAGGVRRAELLLASGFAPVEIELPAEAVIKPGDEVPVRLANPRLFPVS